MEKIIGIYKITNLISGKIYIGSSTNIRSRIAHHYSDLKKQRHHNLHLQNSYNKYGRIAFISEVLEDCTLSNLIEREQYYIDSLKPEYNKLPIANSSAGRKLSEEHIRRIIEGHKKSTGGLRVKVDQYTKEMSYIKTFNSIKDAALMFGGTPANISKCVRGLSKSAYGYVWKYTTF